MNQILLDHQLKFEKSLQFLVTLKDLFFMTSILFFQVFIIWIDFKIVIFFVNLQTLLTISIYVKLRRIKLNRFIYLFLIIYIRRLILSCFNSSISSFYIIPFDSLWRKKSRTKKLQVKILLRGLKKMRHRDSSINRLCIKLKVHPNL